jgi:NAD(P)H-hydrate epimerase
MGLPFYVLGARDDASRIGLQRGDYGLVVDALFGTGLTRALADDAAGLVSALNASGSPILALDLPSGLDCDTGEPLGACVRAAATATFVAPKLGFSNPASVAYTGAVHVVPIGAPLDWPASSA